MKAIRKWLVRRFGYRMVISGGEWDGQQHYAWTVEGAVAWAACYPGNMQKWVFDRKGQAVAYQYAYVR